MSDGTTRDSIDAPPKARTKRPRPCFDDGALTRVFKFPSKTYPRSSYYVTGDEIIIRIKKARKRWKLVVPKKRIKSYRTNRWFAKPRWVEIELTYTQAVRLGLIEPRPQAKDIATDFSAEPQAADDLAPTGDLAVAEIPAPDPEPDDTSDHVLELDREADELEQLAASDEPEPDPRDDQHHDAVAELAVANADRTPAPPALNLVEPVPRSHEPGPVPAARRPAGARPAHRSGASLLAASLALMLAGVAGAWLMLGEPSSSQMANSSGCLHVKGSCAQAIVTGSIAKVEKLPTIEAPAPAEPLAVIEPPAAEDPAPPKLAMNAPEPLDEQREAAPTAAVAAISAKPLELPQDATVNLAPCGELDLAARTIAIQFNYASADVDRANLPALEAFASRLRFCPSAVVMIEGHTDSDGDTDRNEALSVRRAEAVREFLVNAGAKPDQLSVIGFGHWRPQAPNISAENKRKNRRAALVVEQTH